MPSKNQSVEEYLKEIPEDRKDFFYKLRRVILNNLPDGFQEEISSDMISYVVPRHIYPDGYHCSPKLPLPFASIACRKNYFALYHMGLYAKPELMEWFQKEYLKHSPFKPDMGKSCIRFKKPQHIPFDLIGQLMTKMSVNDWIQVYEEKIKSTR